MFRCIAPVLATTLLAVPLLADPQPVVYVGCGFVINKAACDSCQNTADDCSCRGPSGIETCQTNHRVCFEAFRAFQADSSGFHVWKRSVTCYKRYMCNSNSGLDGGFCGGTGQCTTSEEWVYEGGAIEYFISTTCLPI